MSADSIQALCAHCGLPVGRRGTQRSLDGEPQVFCCYGCCLAYQVRQGNTAESEATWLLIRLGVGAFLAMNIKLFSLLLYAGTFEGADAHLLPFVHVLLWALATPMLLILGWPFARDAWQDGRHGRLTANTLMCLGVLAAYGYSAVAVWLGSEHVYFDTVALLLVLFTLGRLLEAGGRARAVRSLAPMLEAERQQATVLDAGGAARQCPVREVVPGMCLRVLPGERIPVDAEVLEGRSHVDESILTGEALPVAKTAGNAVLSGSINHEGPLILRATVAGPASRWALICRAVRDALTRRSPIQRLTDRAAGVFVPLVLLMAGITVLYWTAQAPFQQALFIGLAVLVVACPCALGLAAPLATTLGIGGLIRRGVLVRGPEVLERLAGIRVVAFDKTGTLTAGKMRLAAIETAPDLSEDAFLNHVAGLELGSEHPLARGVVEAARERGLDPVPVSDIRALPGRGVTGRCPEGQITAGSASLLQDDRGWAVPPAHRPRIVALEASGHTVIHAGWGGRWRGALLFDDSLLEDAADTVRRLQRQGLRCVLLTGDLQAAATRAAAATGVDAWKARLTPEDKQREVERLSRTHGPVAMVGDGLNDGPVLAAAAVGVAVGTATDLARETADMVLPPRGLRLLPGGITWARRVRSTTFANLAWAFGYNGVALGLAALGHLSPIWAAAIMAGSSLLVIANSMRLERVGGAAVGMGDSVSAQPVDRRAPRPAPGR
ncbi:MAG: heavy metal translocating P-type ATPase [Aquisalimonadaceae bacterium]